MNSYRKTNRTRKKIAFIGTFIFLMIIIVTSYKNQKMMSFGESALGAIVSPVSKGIYFTSSKAIEGFEKVFGSRRLREEYEELVQENSRLKEQVGVLEDIVLREKALKDEYTLLKSAKKDLKRAFIISKESGNLFVRFNIDKGSKDNIEKNDIIVQGIPAVEDEGENVIEALVGRVESVGYNYSKISTIMDESSDVSFRVQRSGETGVLSGLPGEVLSGYMYHQEADVKIGDQIYTSGLGGVYPRGIYIGEIISIENSDDGLIRRVEVQSPIDYSNLYRVLIMKAKVTSYE